MRKERLNLSEATLVSGWARIWTQVGLSTKPAAFPILNEQVESGVSIPLEEHQRLWEVPWLALTITPGRPTIWHTPMCRFSGNFTGHVQSAAHDSSGWIWGWRWGRLLWGCCRQFTVTEVCKEPGPAHLHSWCWKIVRTFCQCWPAATFLAEILGGSTKSRRRKEQIMLWAGRWAKSRVLAGSLPQTRHVKRNREAFSLPSQPVTCPEGPTEGKVAKPRLRSLEWTPLMQNYRGAQAPKSSVYWPTTLIK